MSVRSAEVANKQHLEGVMKIAKDCVAALKRGLIFRKKRNDDEVSVWGCSWATTMISELSHNKKDKSNESPQRTKNANRLELMDDFLELEKLAYSSNDSPGTKSFSDTSGIANNDQVAVGTDVEKPESDYSKKPNGDEDLLPLANLKSKVSDLLNSLPRDIDSEKLYEEISRAGKRKPVIDYPEFVDRLEEHELIYTRVLGEGDDPLSPIGRGWVSTFMTKYKVGWKAWNDSRVDRRWCKNSYGATAWWQLILVEKMQANDPEKAVTFGDGTPLPAHVVHDCLKILEEESVVIPWQKGADLLLDNLSILHARRAFKPPRRVLASLCK
ncbi:clavaminate synthase-like protein [Tanacetum coccineum]|uniref:Clavaminate synthase-like protein n=1 Tax=Tanacetum coccineum TaxID=301880 RepID=A0ABQ5FNY9_9ASTR